MSTEKQHPQDDLPEVIDIEDFAKTGRIPPKGHRYQFRVDRDQYTTDKECLTGREILAIAGKVPPENWILSQLKRKAVVPVGLDERIDLTEPGIERFMTMPKDQTEGEPRRAFQIPTSDAEGLVALGHFWETVVVPSGNWLLIHNFPVPPGFTCETTTVALQLPGGYPVAALDMVYFSPGIHRADGRPIPQTESVTVIDGVGFQRWSRHYTGANPWKAGEHSILTHLILVRYWIDRELQRAA